MPSYIVLEDHLNEIKYRFFYLCISFIFTTVVLFIYKYELLYLFAGSMIHTFIYTNITESFVSLLNFSLILSVFILFPYFIFQLYQFILPGLYKSEAYLFFMFLLLSLLFYFCSICGVLYLILPYAFQFFMDFQYLNATINFNLSYIPRLHEFLNFIYKILFTFIFLSQIPLLNFIGIYFDILNKNMLIIYRKYAVVLAFIIGAILSPPDITSQLIIAFPILLIYELTIFIAIIKEILSSKVRSLLLLL